MNKYEGTKDINERTFQLAVRIIIMTRSLPNEVASWKISEQIIKSSTSINSNIVQGRAGLSKKDCINHFKIALKEAEETKRWLEMIVAVQLMSLERIHLLIQESTEVIKIIATMIKKLN